MFILFIYFFFFFQKNKIEVYFYVKKDTHQLFDFMKERKYNETVLVFIYMNHKLTLFSCLL